MEKIEIKVFDAYKASEHLKDYEKEGFKGYLIFEYHNQPVNEGGYVEPPKIWKSLKPLKVFPEDVIIKYRYKLNYNEEMRMSTLDKQIEKAKNLVDKLEKKKRNFENEILDDVIEDFDYESIYEGDYWDCHLSPVGHCIYTDDFGEPECIFCGEPEERK